MFQKNFEYRVMSSSARKPSIKYLTLRIEYSVGDKECDSTASRHYTKMKNEKNISKVSEPKLMRICHLNPGMVRGLW